jgi:hypothetical protein
MPWFPDFVSAVELARSQTRAAGAADPIGQFFAALNEGDSHVLEDVWPGEVAIYDPRAGEVRGHRQLRHFVGRNRYWLTQHNARIQTVASTHDGRRAVVEILAHLDGDETDAAWPVAVVAESPDDMSVVFRTYCSQWPVDGKRHVRPPILKSGRTRPGDVVGAYQSAVEAGDVDAVVSTFAADGYYREPIGPHATYRGHAELHSFYAQRFGAGGGIRIQPCAVTDDGVRCAVEYNVIRWGAHVVPPQAGLDVYERDADGLLAAVRAYDDLESPDHGS